MNSLEIDTCLTNDCMGEILNKLDLITLINFRAACTLFNQIKQDTKHMENVTNYELIENLVYIIIRILLKNTDIAHILIKGAYRGIDDRPDVCSTLHAWVERKDKNDSKGKKERIIMVYKDRREKYLYVPEEGKMTDCKEIKYFVNALIETVKKREAKLNQQMKANFSHFLFSLEMYPDIDGISSITITNETIRTIIEAINRKINLQLQDKFKSLGVPSLVEAGKDVLDYLPASKVEEIMNMNSNDSAKATADIIEELKHLKPPPRQYPFEPQAPGGKKMIHSSLDKCTCKELKEKARTKINKKKLQISLSSLNTKSKMINFLHSS